ncbi:hypothetical protein F2P45_33700 [Massilia sp. CCM 8733]|uniref:Uncharacterized protein n=1 Tax=Massilia mucilaginosa TaxID=2609282 RepID=A0ABX0P4C3_9BURK|nr:hypothetical protein [Massilia mucilaginosa]NHZ93913.1 hypothetical protein [Massilia mucilaginosa]
MSKKIYFGENELRQAIALIRRRVAEASSFDEVLPLTVDASYTHEDYGDIVATLTMQPYASKHRPEACYLIEMKVKMPHCKVSSILTINPKDKIEGWFDEIEGSNGSLAFLADIYQLEEESDGPRLL